MRLFSVSLAMLLLCGCQTTHRPQHKKVHRPVVRQKQIFLVIDDAGLDINETRQFLDIPVPMTIAVLPHLEHTRKVCREIARRPDKEIILHQPMEAYDRSKETGPGAIYSTTRPQDVRTVLDRNLKSVRGAVGINNHMGSRVTENEAIMTEVLRYCRAQGLFFLDSKTAFNSVVQRAAKREHMHFEDRDVFLDVQHDRESVRRAWESTVTKARNRGYAIAIGHIWSKETADAIRDSYQTLLNQGYTFHKLSELYE